MSGNSTSPTLDKPYVEPAKALCDDQGVLLESDNTPFRYLKRRVLNISVLGLADMLALMIGLFAAGLLRYALRGESMIPEWSWVVLVAWGVGALFFGLLPGWGLGAVEELRRVALLTVAVFAVVAVGLFLGKTGSQTSRLTLSTTFALAIPFLLLFRLQAKRILIKLKWWGLPTVIYGGGRTARLIIHVLDEEKGLGYVPVGTFSDNRDLSSPNLNGIPFLGSVTESTEIAPAAILAMSDLNRHRLVDLLEGPLASYRQVLLIPDLADAPSLWVETRDLGGVLGLEVSHNLLDPFARIMKRIADLAFVITTSPLWVPLCFVLYLVIRLQDGGDPIFSQTRMGIRGASFQTWKFRTMVPDAEKVLQQRLNEDHELRAEWESNFKLKNDPRITRLGSFLRRTSLDELPQFFNVLLGNMSLVGPRPLPVYHYEELPQRIRNLRERVAPGITGLWQVSGRSDSGTKGMRRWDAYYVRNWSIWLDAVILVRTFRAVFQKQGAY